MTAEGVEERRPKNTEEWQAVKAAAVNLTETGNLLMMPPRAQDGGPWMKNVQAMMAQGQKMIEAIDRRDTTAMFDIGSDLYDTCTNCHMHYMPAIKDSTVHDRPNRVDQGPGRPAPGADGTCDAGPCAGAIEFGGRHLLGLVRDYRGRPARCHCRTAVVARRHRERIVGLGLAGIAWQALLPAPIRSPSGSSTSASSSGRTSLSRPAARLPWTRCCTCRSTPKSR